MTSPHPRPRILKVLAVAILACLISTPVVQAQNKRETGAAKERLHELTKEAERLMKIGRVNEAEKLLVKARELKSWLGKATNRKEGSDDYHGLFGNLKEAIGILRELGRKEHAQKLAQFTEQLYADLQRRRPKRERERKRDERDRNERGNGERAEAKRQLQVMRYAKAAFDEAGKKDALDLIERVMHARELQLEGRRDREARQIIAKAPGNDDVVEILGWAAKILAEYGAEEKAAAVKGLAGQLSGRRRPSAVAKNVIAAKAGASAT